VLVNQYPDLNFQMDYPRIIQIIM